MIYFNRVWWPDRNSRVAFSFTTYPNWGWPSPLGCSRLGLYSRKKIISVQRDEACCSSSCSTTVHHLIRAWPSVATAKPSLGVASAALHLLGTYFLLHSLTSGNTNPAAAKLIRVCLRAVRRGVAMCHYVSRVVRCSGCFPPLFMTKTSRSYCG